MLYTKTTFKKSEMATVNIREPGWDFNWTGENKYKKPKTKPMKQPILN